MEYVLQYHNADKNGLYLGEDEASVFGDGVWDIGTSRSFVQREVGSDCFMIVGIGNPRRYYLWNCFTIESVAPTEDNPDHFVAVGSGWMLNPPQLLSGSEFQQFQEQCANFASFKNISHLDYTQHLIELAHAFHKPETDQNSLDFCNELVQFASAYPDVFKLRAFCLMHFEEDEQAIEDLMEAKEMYDELQNYDEAAFCERVIEELRNPTDASDVDAGDDELPLAIAGSKRRYILAVPNAEAMERFKEIKHKQFQDSIVDGKWDVNARGQIRPQSICWLYVWATNTDAKYQGTAEYLRRVFDEIMPFTYTVFDTRVGKDLAIRLRDRPHDDEVQAGMERRLLGYGFDGRYGSELSKTADKTADDGYFSPSSLKDEREKKQREIVQRRGQCDFRRNLIAAYNGRCAVTGCDAVSALEAAHIRGYCGPSSDHIANGLLLRADIHTLFDLDLIGIDPDSLKVALAEELRGTCYDEFSGKPIAVPENVAFRPNKEMMRERWSEFERIK
jgi:hypothetical protein